MRVAIRTNESVFLTTDVRAVVRAALAQVAARWDVVTVDVRGGRAGARGHAGYRGTERNPSRVLTLRLAPRCGLDDLACWAYRVALVAAGLEESRHVEPAVLARLRLRRKKESKKVKPKRASALLRHRATEERAQGRVRALEAELRQVQRRLERAKLTLSSAAKTRRAAERAMRKELGL